jgi:hypothetical protein
MATVATYLQLAPEFGGTKFGPFQGVEIRLGSDPTRNDIVLPEALGVLPAHVRVIRQADNSFILAPTERTATVYLHRNDARAPKLVTTPTAIQTGDGFSLVTAEGPRFHVLVEQPQKAGAGGDTVAPPKPKKPGAAEGVMAEFKRLGFAKFFTTKAGSFLNTAWMMVKTGTIFSPRYIVMGLMMVVPLMMAGGASCAAISFKWQSDKKEEQIVDLKSDLDACGAGDSGADPTVASLTQAILGDREWQQSLEADPQFNLAYLQRLKSIFERSDRYAWVFQRKKSELTTLMGRMDSSMGKNLARVFAYTAAHPGFVPERQWGLVQANSEGQRTCGRGATLMTFRQATNLGVNAQPDALADAGIATSEDLDAKAALIKAALGGDRREFENVEIQQEGAGLQGGYQCLYLEGSDDRTDPKALAAALGKALGPKAKGLPEEGTDHWITSRLVKYFAADFIFGFEDLTFTKSKAPSVVIAEAAPPQKTFALENAAEIAARAVAIPCMAILEKESTEHLGASPTLVQCGVLRLLVERDL